MIGGSYRCGPLAVALEAANAALEDKVVETFNLYTVTWPNVESRISLEVRETDQPATMVEGTYLTCGRMHVCATASGLLATCRSGVSCRSDASGETWIIEVPKVTTTGETVPEDIEDLVGLVLTTGWRRLNWVPLHAGCVVRGANCAILCATSGGGKTTLTAALIRRGWKTLGDDKLLLRLDEAGEPRLFSLISNFNLHPNTRSWFPEVGDLSVLPRYSAWTEKRKVRIEDIWPDRVLEQARPSHLIEIHRSQSQSGVAVDGLPRDRLLSTLLRQTVIPSEPTVARRILGALSKTAPQLDGLRVVLGENVYRDQNCLSVLEEAMS